LAFGLVTMADLDHFTFDLFLSYGWAGIGNPQRGDRGWVAEFKDQLEAQLSSELGRCARIHLDVEQSKNGELPENLREAVIGSATFLSVITEGSCKPGSWCHRELGWFLHEGAEVMPNRRQLFSLLLRNVDQKTWPQDLQDIVPSNFLNDLTPRGPVPQGELGDTSTEAGQRVQRLAIEIAHLLQHIDEEIARTVLLASSDAALRAQIERLAIEINKRGGHAVSLSYQTGESEHAFRDRYLRDLNRASLLVYLVADADAATPDGWSASLERVYMEGGNLRFGHQARQVIVWRAGTATESDDWANAQVLKTMGFEYLHSLLCQTLQSSVDDAAARALARQQVRANGRPDVNAAPKYVFIECVQEDLERLAPVREKLQAKGCQVKFPLFQGDRMLRRREDLEFLAKCRAAAVYFGSRSDLETHLACQTLAETIADQALSIPQAVLLDPYSDPVRKFFFYPGFNNYPFNADDFVNSIA
jgi:hypothetical protein